MKQQICAGILAAAVLLTPWTGTMPLASGTVYAAEEALTDAASGLQYVTENGGVTITGADLTAASITIPSEIAGLPVRTIGSHAFYNSQTGGNHVLQSVTLPDSLTAIAPHAFSGCSKLTAVTLPDSCTRIGEYAFQGCSSLTQINIPEGVTIIKPFTFANCGFQEISLPETVMEVDSNAFASCQLVALELPVGVALVGESAFAHNQMLQYAILPGVVQIGDNAFEACTNMKAVLFSEALQSIGAGAFSNCKALTEVELPEGLESIGDYAFGMYAGVNALTIPESVEWLGSGVCPGAVETIDGVKYIGNWAVGTEGTPESVTLREGTVGIAKNALSVYTLTEVTLPSSLQYFDGDSFGASNPRMTAVHVPEDNAAFCDVDGVVYSKDGSVLIYYSGGRTDAAFTVPDGVLYIGTAAFANAKTLESVTFPDGLLVIAERAFSGCNALAGVHFPEGLLRIGAGAFRESEALFGSELPDSLLRMGHNAFPLMGGSRSALMTDGWYDAEYSGYNGAPLEIREGAVGLTDSLFANRTMKSAVIPDSVIFPGTYTFWHCADLESVTIGSGLIGIAEGDFGKCFSLREITLPENISFIEAGAFMECDALERITILDPECQIEDSPFSISETAVICGYAGSTAEAYAKAYDRPFEALGSVRGDVNADGVFSVLDVVAMQHWLVADGTVLADWRAGDLNGDGRLDILDLAMMKRELTAKQA